MKKIFFVFSCILLMLSCKDDESRTSLISYGNIHKEGDNLKILRDDGSWLAVQKSSVPFQSLADGQRVIVRYEILSEAVPEVWPTTYPVYLQGLNTVLCKPPVEASFIDENYEHRSDSIGNDPLEVIDAWFGGDYLNINLLFLEAGVQGRHFINLVHEYPHPDNDTVYLTLRHNGYDPVYRVDHFARVSFDLSGLVPEGASGIDIRLMWESYTGDKSDEGTFTLRSASPAILSPERGMTGRIPARAD